MSLRIDKARAAHLVRAASTEAELGKVHSAWAEKVERLSRLCEEGNTKTHIAFLGTAMIAKATHQDVDLFAIKPRRAPDNPKAFSARTLCHSVLVPLAADLGFSIGVTGREPLNNQPYFRIVRLGDDTPVHPSGRTAFDYMVQLVGELQALPTESNAREALVAFIAVRRRHQPRYIIGQGVPAVTPTRLVGAVESLVQDESENGKRAQAVVAGLMDAFAGRERVESGRVNDPSRRHPGDVCVSALEEDRVWEKAFEVRDKPVSISDVQVFTRKCMEMGVREAAVVAVSDLQPALDSARLAEWAAEFGIGVTVFTSWRSIVDQTLFWSADPKPLTASRAVGFIHDRLIGVEAKPHAVELWVSLTR